MPPDPKHRFSNRVEDYIKYRPSYPPAVLDLLEKQCRLSPGAGVADIGSGTGIFSELLLKRGYHVAGVEPNNEMRAAAESLLAKYPNFKSIAASAEATTLPDASVDLITASQAFHWFKPAEARAEFRRIAKPGAYAALIWNVRPTQATPFLAEYEAMLVKHCPDYPNTTHNDFDESRLAPFFGASRIHRTQFYNSQIFNLPDLHGRLRSSSYVPLEGPAHEAIINGAKALFEKHSVDGKVTFEYDTQVFYGVIREL